MNRVESRIRFVCGVLGLLGVLALLAGCDREARTDDSAVEHTETTRAGDTLEADASAVPDFRRYMLGDLPTTGTAARDPFGARARVESSVTPPAKVAPVQQPTPSLRGIVRSQGQLVALFDRGSAVTGDSVAGWRVVEIEPRAVVIEKDSRRLRISL